MKEVDNYIEKQKSPQKEILQKVREIILKTFPEIKEDFWVGVPWYDRKCYIVGLKDHVNIGFCIDGLSEKELALFEVLLPDAAQKHGLVRDIEVDREGFVHAPTAPGLGYEIDWELIERNKIDVLR